MTSFSDIFKSSFLENVTRVSVVDMLLCLALAFALGLFIAFVYRKTYTGVMYSSGFGGTLIALTMITAMVILAVTSNVVLSLGMVGALSIVRFRTAVKDPLDTAYMFWALTTGILLGAGQFLLTVVAMVLIAIMMTVLVNIQPRGVSSYLLVIRAGAEAERPVAQLVSGIRVQKLKSKTVNGSSVEMTYEVRVDKPDALLNRLNNIPGVIDATLVSYQGEAA